MLNEEQKELAKRCAEAIGADSETDVLCRVLAHFPTRAELFIETMQYAEKMTGKKAVHYIVVHKRDAYNADNSKIYSAGESETLGVYGYTGEKINKFISLIDRLRGVGGLGILDFSADDHGECDAIVAIFDNEENNLCDDDLASMIRIMLEVMAVTPEEIALIREAIEVNAVSKDLGRESEELRRQAQAKEDTARNVRLEFAERLNLIYPRRTEESYKK